jgi:hypothetical protein
VHSLVSTEPGRAADGGGLTASRLDRVG